MNKKVSKRASRETGALSFKRETVRALSTDEMQQVAGGMKCTSDSCLGRTCPNSVCTITVDTTM